MTQLVPPPPTPTTEVPPPPTEATEDTEGWREMPQWARFIVVALGVIFLAGIVGGLLADEEPEFASPEELAADPEVQALVEDLGISVYLDQALPIADDVNAILDQLLYLIDHGDVQDVATEYPWLIRDAETTLAELDRIQVPESARWLHRDLRAGTQHVGNSLKATLRGVQEYDRYVERGNRYLEQALDRFDSFNGQLE